jgi:acetyltransferase-like isoleucine patch superfamily enzyme
MDIRDEIRARLESEYGLRRSVSRDAKIGSGFRAGSDVIIEDGVEIGAGVQLGNRVTLRNCRIGDGVRVEDDCIIGYATTTGGFTHQFDERHRIVPTTIGAGTIVRSGSVIYLSVSVGENCWINHHVILREHTRIGSHSCIGTMSDSEGYNRIGNHVLIHSQVFLCSHMTIEDYVFVAPRVVFTDGNPMNFARDVAAPEGGPTVRFGTQIGANAVVLPRLIVGYEAVIGAAAVVTKDVPALSVVVGVPGKVVGRVADALRMPEALRRQYYDGRSDPEDA